MTGKLFQFQRQHSPLLSEPLQPSGPGATHLIRKDIEGLRAIAVLAVVLNHLQSSALQGGFAGVDVFFVISGFLIGLHLLQDIQEDRFSFLRFYARRARRLLPALTVVLAVVWCFGWLILSGPEFTDLGRHMTAATLFANNILLCSQSGYFDTSAATKPLLHLWSLGVEEQFYLLVPLLLWLSSARGRASIHWVLRLSAVSLLLALWYPLPSFYLLDTRFWELGAGVTVAYASLRGLTHAKTMLTMTSARRQEWVAFAFLLMFIVVLVFSSQQDPWDESSLLASCGLIVIFTLAIAAIRITTLKRASGHLPSSALERLRPHANSIASFVGLLLIGMSLIYLTPVGWPGPQAVFPVLGTALVIAAGPNVAGNKMLANGVFVFIGGISYPLYLWHWPVLVFWKMFELDVSGYGKALPAFCAVLLAWLTKNCIERPVRLGTFETSTGKIPQVGFAFAGLAIVGIVGASTVLTAGYPARFPTHMRAIANWSMPLPDVDWRPNRCFFRRDIIVNFAAECTPPMRPGFQHILLWGDSHAAHLYPGLANLRTTYDFDLAQWTSAACPPVRVSLIGEDSACSIRRAKELDDLNQNAPDTVILSAAWEMYLARGTREDAIMAAVEDDIGWLRERGVKRIVLFGPVPTWSTSSDVFKYMLRNRLKQIPERLGNVSDTVRHLDNAMAALAETSDVPFVSVINRFCNEQGCLLLGDRQRASPDLLYRDQDHLTLSGSKLLIQSATQKILEPL